MEPVSTTFAASGMFDPSNIGDATFSFEDPELAQNLAQNMQWQMPETRASTGGDGGSCMTDFLSLLKVVLPVVAPLM